MTTQRVYDDEDAAQSAFHSICAGIAEGRFPDVFDRGDLWNLLVVITARKVAHCQRHDRPQRREVRRNLTDSILNRSSDDAAPADVENSASRDPTPEFAAAFEPSFRVLSFLN